MELKLKTRNWFKSSWRIYSTDGVLFIVESKPWWWPMWVYEGYYLSVEAAKEAIMKTVQKRNRASRSLEYLGKL